VFKIEKYFKYNNSKNIQNEFLFQNCPAFKVTVSLFFYLNTSTCYKQ